MTKVCIQIHEMQLIKWYVWDLVILFYLNESAIQSILLHHMNVGVLMVYHELNFISYNYFFIYFLYELLEEGKLSYKICNTEVTGKMWI